MQYLPHYGWNPHEDTPETLAVQAEATGFRPDMLEKVALLLQLLDTIRSHPFLKDKLVLKGGTDLNIFIFHFPRLSVDIDLNYMGAADRETMLLERPKVEEALQAVFSQEGYTVRRVMQAANGSSVIQAPTARAATWRWMSISCSGSPCGRCRIWIHGR